MKKNKKVLSLIIYTIVGIIAITAVFFMIKRNREHEISNIKKEIENYGYTFYKMISSKEKGYKKDIYISMPIEAVNESGESSNYYFEQIINDLSETINDKNYRIIEKYNNIIIRVKAESGNITYTINNSSNYFETEKVVLFKKDEVEKIDLTVKAKVLNDIISNDWGASNIKSYLGTVENVTKNYEYYTDEGYKVKTNNQKIYNIVFTKDYKEDVFEGIKTGIDNIQIRKLLGDPLYEGEDANAIVGYKTDDYYVFFQNGEISVYQYEEFDSNKNNEFASLVTELNRTGDYKRFINKVKELYTDFDENSENIISYPTKGFKITSDETGKYEITIYNNYEGKITNDVSMSDVKNGQSSLPDNFYFDIRNQVFIAEVERKIND